MRQRYTGPKLPAELQNQLGVSGSNGRGSRDRRRPVNRKEQRRATRVEKKRQYKFAGRGRPSINHNGKENSPGLGSEDEEDIDWDNIEEDATPPPILTKASQPRPKSILKKTLPAATEDAPTSIRISRAVKDKLAQEDAEIAALEKKLGVKGKKSSKGADDGLDDVFRDLGDLSDDHGQDNQVTKRERTENSDWLASKRRKALGAVPDEFSEEDTELSGFNSSDTGSDQEMKREEDFDMDDYGTENFTSNGSKTEEPKVRENPYKAPIASEDSQTTKYLPPALRAHPSSEDESLLRLRRQIKGLLNRLSDANILTILRDIEVIYQNNPRGHVNIILVDLLISMLSDPSTLLDTFLILHAGFIAAIYKVIGPDFAAQMVEHIVSEIDSLYRLNKEGTGKQTTNLISVIAELYMFQVVGCNIVFDYIRFFLAELSEINTELLLRIVRAAGSQLRQDDPTALKDIVVLLQKSVAKVGQANLPVRTKFMIETINDLKNNRMKTGIAASAVSREHVTRMKKQLGTLNSRNLKATEPLRVGLNDIRDTEKKGKWWLVGASWRNEANHITSTGESKNTDQTRIELEDDGEDSEVDLVQLAREQRMNTDIRRAIFVSIMSASDFKDAQMRLSKLNLKKSQETEIPRVLVHCAGVEEIYNPYYTVLARRICLDHKTRKSFQFALWDIFKSLGEKQDGSESLDNGYEAEDSDGLCLRKLVNQGKLYGTLIGKKVLPITCLKNLNFPYLQPKTRTFVDILLVTTIQESLKANRSEDQRNERVMREVFVEVDQAPEMIAGLQWFLKKVTRKTDIVDGQDKDTVQWACKSITDMLTQVLATTTMQEH